MKKILFLIIITISLVGCSKDFLDRSPITKKVAESFYKTPKDASQSLTSVYNILTYEDTNPINLLAEIASDNCFGGGGATDADGLVRYDRFLPQIGDAANQTLWRQYYTGIFRANTLLENIGSVEWGADTTMKTQIICEARFLRAYFNFNLARFFGAVPLV